MKRTRIVLFLLLSLMLVTGASAAAQSTAAPTGNAPARADATAASTRWSSSRIDRAAIGSGDDRGKFVSMAIKGGTTYISYYDATSGKLKYARWDGGLGNCGDPYGGNTVWWCDTIDDMGSPLTQAGISLALDGNGYPNIVYQDASDPMGPAVLKIARPKNALGQSTGNCGPSGGWQCDVLDMGGSETNEGDYASIAFNSAGLATIAYHESDGYYGTGYLKVLQQLLQLSLPLIKK